MENTEIELKEVPLNNHDDRIIINDESIKPNMAFFKNEKSSSSPDTKTIRTYNFSKHKYFLLSNKMKFFCFTLLLLLFFAIINISLLITSKNNELFEPWKQTIKNETINNESSNPNKTIANPDEDNKDKENAEKIYEYDKIITFQINQTQKGFYEENELSPFANRINVKITLENADELNIKIYDEEKMNEQLFLKEEYPFPYPKNVTNEKKIRPNFILETNDSNPFFIKIKRKGTNETIFDTSNSRFIFSKRYIEFSTQLPTSHLFGLGERNSDLKYRPGIYSIWNRNAFGEIDTGTPGHQSSGSHPVYLSKEKSGNFNMMLIKTTNGLQFEFNEESKLVFKLMGGYLDIKFLLGEQEPEKLIKKYHSYVNGYELPPLWLFGVQFQLESNIENLTEKLNDFRIPIDVLWLDQDYINASDIKSIHKIYRLNFSIDSSKSSLLSYGLENDVFVKSAKTNLPLFGCLDGKTVAFPDFNHPNITKYWEFFIKESLVDLEFDGINLALNEPYLDQILENQEEECSNARIKINLTDELANYSAKSCKIPKFNGQNLPFTPQKFIEKNSLPLDGYHFNESEFFKTKDLQEIEFHNLNGFLSSYYTKKIIRKLKNEEALVFSHSSLFGSGSFSMKITDIQPSWTLLHTSISSLLSSQFFSQFSSIDICSQSSPLCLRYLQLGVLFPILRIKIDETSSIFKNVMKNDTLLSGTINENINFAEILNLNLKLRYSLLHYTYGLLINNNGSGTLFRPLFFEFPKEEKSLACENQFLIGNSLMVAPSLDIGERISVYFPKESKWVKFDINGRTDQIFHSQDGFKIDVESKINATAPLFVREGSIIYYQNSTDIKLSNVSSLNNVYNLFILVKNISKTEFFAKEDISIISDYGSNWKEKCLNNKYPYEINKCKKTITMRIEILPAPDYIIQGILEVAGEKVEGEEIVIEEIQVYGIQMKNQFLRKGLSSLLKIVRIANVDVIIELTYNRRKNGGGSSIILREDKKNFIYTQKYNIFNFLPKTILRFFFRTGNLFYLLIAIILLTQTDLAPFQNWMIIFFIALMLVIYMVVELACDLNRWRKDKQINQNKTKIARREANGDIDLEVSWSDLDLGDIILLEKNEVCPADIIILDTSEILGKEAICYVDTSSIDGVTSFSKKKAASVSQIANRLPTKNVFPEYRKTLSGIIGYDSPNSRHDHFSGFLRLKKDPKIDKLDISNFISRGSTLKYADWVYGLVVFTGSDTKIFMNSNFSIHKKGFLESMTQYYFLIAGVIVVFFGMINTVVIIAVAKQNPKLFYIDPSLDDTARFFIYVIFYSPIMPIFLYGFIDLSNLAMKTLIERKFATIFKNEDIKINYPRSFINIANVDYLLLEKTGTLTRTEYKINRIFFNNKIYNFDPLVFQKAISNIDKMKIFNLPFKNVQTKGETMFATSLVLNSSLQSSQINGTAYLNNAKPSYQKVLSVVDEKDVHKREECQISFDTHEGEINEIAENDSFTFDRRMIDEEPNGNSTHNKKNSKNILNGLYGEENSDKNRNSSINSKKNRSTITKTKDVAIELGGISSKNGIFNDNFPLIQKNNEDSFIKQGLNYSNIQDSSRLPLREEKFMYGNSDQSSRKLVQFQENEMKNILSSSVGHGYDYKKEKNFIDDLLKPSCDENLDNLLEAMALCHHGKAQPSSSELSCGRKEDEVILDFCRKCFFVYDKNDMPDNPSQYYFKFKNNKYVYNIIGVNEYFTDKRSFSIVFKSPLVENEVQLICKGEEDYMRNLMNLDKKELEIYDSILRDMHNEGLKTIVYAKKTLENNEANNYYHQIRNLKTSLLSQDEELKNLGKSVENDMELLLIIGIKDEMMEGADDMIQFCNDLKLNVWMTTGDSRENALATAYSTKFLHPTLHRSREIIQEDEELINVVLNNHLNEIKNIYTAVRTDITKGSDEAPINRIASRTKTDQFFAQIQSEQCSENVKIFQTFLNRMNSYCLIFSGPSLDIILRSNTLKPHFIFLLAIIKKVIGYNLTPQNKGTLVDIIKNNFVNQPTVMALGEGLKDNLMFQKSDIGVEMMNFKTAENHRMDSADVTISSLAMLKQLMLKEGTSRLLMQDSMIIFLFYQAFLMGIMLFLFYWVCPFRPNNIFFSLLVIFYFLIFGFFNTFTLGLFNKPIEENVFEMLPILYNEGKLIKRRFLTRFCVKAFGEALLHALIVYGVSIEGFSGYLNEDGKSSSILVLVLGILFSLILLNNLKLFFKCKVGQTRLVLITFPLCVILLVIYAGIVVEVAPFGKNWKIEIQFLFENMTGYMIILFNLVTCLLVTFLLNNFVFNKFGFSLYDYLGKYLKEDKNIRSIKTLLSMNVENLIDISTLVKEIFKNGESLNPSIQEMFTASDINVNEIELNKYTLAIQEKSIENKYNFIFKRQYNTRFMSISIFLIIILTIYSIILLASKEDQTYGIICISLSGFMLVLWTYTWKEDYRKNYYLYTKILIFIAVIAKIIIDWLMDDYYAGIRGALLPLLSSMNLNLGIVFVFGINLFYGFSYFISIALMYYSKYPNVIKLPTPLLNVKINDLMKDLIPFYTIWMFVLYVLSIAIISLFANYKFEKLKRAEYLAKMRLEKEGTNIQDIFAILVPKFIKDRMNQGVNFVQEAQDDVGILFCDICDFDKLIKIEGPRIVQILDEIFRNFDNLCLKHGIQKIETVGKTYMACAGLKLCEVNFPDQVLKTEKTRRMVSMALEMMKYIESLTYGKGEVIKIKIGIHNGRVISGVIGDHKPQFSLIGDTVNTTSRVCSTGVDGGIIISEQAYENVKNSNITLEQRVVQAKGKGDLITYVVLNQKKTKKFKKSKLKMKIESHMREIREAYEQIRQENKQSIDPKYNKAVNLMTTWLVQNKIEEDDGKGFFNEKEDESNGNIRKADTLKLEKSGFVGNNLQKNLVINSEILLTFDADQDNQLFEFQNSLYLRHLLELKISIFALTLAYFVHTLLLIAIETLLEYHIFVLAFRASYVLLLSVLMCSLFCLKRRNFRRFFFILIYYYGIVCTLIYIKMALDIKIKEVGLLELIFIHLVFINSTILSFVEVLTMSFSLLVGYIIVFALDSVVTEQTFLFIFVFLIFHILKMHHQISYNIDSHNQMIENEFKREKQNSLVSQLLPFHAFEKLKHVSLTNKLELTDTFQNVTILFADIAGFTKYSSSVRPEDVVNMLSKLFTKFDKECVRHKVYKVYTIGDCYVVLGFINANQRNIIEEAKNVVKMGQSMIEIIRVVRQEANFLGLDMRIGIHTGDIIGGIIGTDIVRYDIYGKDVLIANKMESNGTEGNIMVSESTKVLLEKDENNNYIFQKKMDVESKVLPYPIGAYLIYQK